VLRDGPDGKHYYLDGRRLFNGARVELLLAGATWLVGTFEWRRIEVVWPSLRISLAGRVSRLSDRNLSSAVPIPPGTTLRWADPDDLG
jgi:hypothetical protein